MRLPTYVYRSRHGIYFFRIVVPLALRNALSGQREIKRSLRTRDKRQALVQARALELDLYPVFAKAVAMSKFNNPPTVQDVLAAAHNGRKLTITGPQVMPDGSTVPYTVKTDSDSVHELEAAKAVAVKLHALHHTLTQIRPKEPTDEEWARFETEQQLLREILLPDGKTATGTPSAVAKNPPPAA